MADGSVNALHIALVAAVTGWLVFSFSHSIAIWNKRNAGGASRTSFRLLYIALLLAIVGIAGGWLNRELTRRVGVVAGSDFFVVRARSGANVTLVDSKSVNKGSVLATYNSPETEREAQKLRSQLEVLIAQRNVKALEPLVLSSGLIHAAQDEGDSQRARLTELGFGALGYTANLKGQPDPLAAQIAKNYDAQLKLQRTKALVAEGVLAQQALDSAVATAQAAEQELHEREQLVNIARRGEEEVKRTQAALTQDSRRASAERSAGVLELDAKIAQLRGDLAQFDSEQVIQAPFSGTVVYRDPSAAVANQNTVILALAKGAGFIATVQIPARESRSLVLGQTLGMGFQHSIVSQEISGKLISIEAVPGVASKVNLRIECNLPPEQFGAFANGSVPVTLEWRPGLLTEPISDIGLSCACFCALIWLLMQIARIVRLTNDSVNPEAAEVDLVLAQLGNDVRKPAVNQ